MCLPLSSGLFKLNLESTQEAWHQLVDFQEADVLSDTCSSPSAELQHGSLHFLEFVRASLNPALGPECINVYTKNLGSTLYDPGVTADNRATRDEFAADLHALFRHDALKDETRCRVKSERFLDDSVKIGKLLGFGPRDCLVGTRFDSSVCYSGVELLHELQIYTWVLDKEIEDS